MTLFDDSVDPLLDGRSTRSRSLAGRRGQPVPGPGASCINAAGEAHPLAAVEDDHELQTVARWMGQRADLAEQIGDAIEDAIFYVLDGWRTHRFDLLDPRVDSDERRSVGTKLQYHLIENLGLEKMKHPDTEVDGVGLEIKGTVRDNWAIPTEGQCGVTLLVRLDLANRRHQSRLMRTHRAWLRSKPNKDGKRGVAAIALADYSLDLYSWRGLRRNPLTLLSERQQMTVFGAGGQEPRFVALFEALPGHVVPRAVIQTVGANRADPLRRVRAIRSVMRHKGLALLCGRWLAQRQLAAELGYDLTGDAWVAVPWGAILGSKWSDEVIAQMEGDGAG